MGKRRKSRKLASQFLYQISITGTDSWEKFLDAFLEDQNAPPDVGKFTGRIVREVIARRDKIDGVIATYATNWDIKRIAMVDKNILRIGVCELLYMDDIPPIVSINEAVDIAKKYGAVDSGKFVNGVLDKIRLELVKEKG